MIERANGGFDVHCDGCSNAEFIDVEEWGELMTEMEAMGWKSINVDGDWEHRCPVCIEKENDSDGPKFTEAW